MKYTIKQLLQIAFILFLITCSHSLFSQTIATLKVEAGKYKHSNTPVSVNLSTITNLPDSALVLEEIVGNKISPTPYQIEEGRERTLYWILKGETKAGTARTFQLVNKKNTNPATEVMVKNGNGDLVIKVADKNVLQYNYRTVFPPEGASPYYKRSGFIHPLWSPQGAELTTIQPKDHYHHYGIWNPWTKTTYEGKEIDFWNLAAKLGTVRYKNLISIEQGPVFGGFKALHEHVVYPDSVAEKIAMKEVWNLRVFNIQENVYLIDFTSTLNMATQSTITLEEYRYGGFGMRATEEWTNKNTKALTSEGKTRKDADGSRARWAWVNGETSKGIAGVLFMSNPTNYNYPEPIRMWPLDANNGRGDVFFNFSPTKNKKWDLVAGKEYCLRYRMLVFEGEISPEQAESYWADFAEPPVVKVVQKK